MRGESVFSFRSIYFIFDLHIVKIEYGHECNKVINNEALVDIICNMSEGLYKVIAKLINKYYRFKKR